MKLRNITEVQGFLDTVNQCNGSVWLESPDGDKFNLKSKFSQYIAVGALIGIEAENLELYCSKREDEEKFFEFFNNNPGVL